MESEGLTEDIINNACEVIEASDGAMKLLRIIEYQLMGLCDVIIITKCQNNNDLGDWMITIEWVNGMTSDVFVDVLQD